MWVDNKRRVLFLYFLFYILGKQFLLLPRRRRAIDTLFILTHRDQQNQRGSTPSFFADLIDNDELSPQDMARRSKFVEKRRQRTEKHVINHAESILSRVLQIEAEDELQAPQDQPEEQVEAINDNSGGSSRASSLSARRSERHHFAVAFDILSELDDDEGDEEF